MRSAQSRHGVALRPQCTHSKCSLLWVLYSPCMMGRTLAVDAPLDHRHFGTNGDEGSIYCRDILEDRVREGLRLVLFLEKPSYLMGKKSCS